MTLTEGKKYLYKNKPKANFFQISDGLVIYQTVGTPLFQFEIPIDDLKGGKFFPQMDAQLLIRWLTLID